MRLCLFYFQTQKQDWAESAAENYFQKINHFENFELIPIKSKSASRDSQELKLRSEEKALLEKINDKDELILFDPKGQKFSSETFADFLKKKKESGKLRICFAIGGAYGFSAEVKKRAQTQISFSDLTMNHHVALIVALEQLYRAGTIERNIPYHNG